VSPGHSGINREILMRRIYGSIALLMLSVAGLGVLTSPTSVGVRPNSNARAANRATNFYATHLPGVGNLPGSSLALNSTARLALPGILEKVSGKPRPPKQGISSLPMAA
jgi:hypothetical protein